MRSYQRRKPLTKQKQEHLVWNSRALVILALALFALVLSLLYENPFTICVQDKCSINLKLFSHLALEIAFALIIALGVSLGIEHQSRQADLNANEQMRKLIAEDVFRGVFAKDLPENYVEKIIGYLLKIDTIRDYIRIFDRIEENPENIEKVLLVRNVKYRVRNISHIKIIYPIRFYFHSDDLEDLNRSGMTSMTIGVRQISEVALRKMKRTDTESGTISFELMEEIEAGQTLDVELGMVIVKQKNDTEVFGALDPSMKLIYSIRSAIPLKRLGLTDRSLTPATKQSCDVKAGIGDWEIDGPFLKDNSISTWWECT